jgi:EmrB/QacA subfamily drug resistance transporter
MIILDFAIVSVALPNMQGELHFHDGDAQWVISGYSIVFAGCLMLAGRLADLIGRRRMFFLGLLLFTLAAFAGGFSPTGFFLIVMRCIQGLGAAMVNPAALALVTATFAPGPLRNKALSLWGVIGSSGVMAGMLIGGVLTSTLGWRSVLFVNVPIGILILILTPVLIPKDAPATGERRIDYGGAALLTAAMLLFVYTMVRGPENGWLSPLTLGLGALSLALLAGFIVLEKRIAYPLVPLSLFAVPNVSAAAALCAFQAAAYVAVFVYTSLYMQTVLHWNPFTTGLAFLPMTFVISAIAGPFSAPMAQRFGARNVAFAGTIIMLAGALIMSFVDPDDPYWIAILPGTLVGGFGDMLAYEMSMILGLEQVGTDQDGVASALLSTTVQIGLSFGVAVPAIFGGGAHAAYLVAVAFSACSLACVLFLKGAPGTKLSSHIALGHLMHRVR